MTKKLSLKEEASQHIGQSIKIEGETYIFEKIISLLRIGEVDHGNPNRKNDYMKDVYLRCMFVSSKETRHLTLSEALLLFDSDDHFRV